MAGFLERLGCEVDIFEPDNERMKAYPGYNQGHSYAGRPVVVGTYRGTGGGKSLILNGHMDTMPSGDLDRWETDPWKLSLIHISNPDIKGLYQFINQQFLVHEFPDVALVNREDDVGMEGLRKAKMSYNPIGFARKYMVRKR